MSSNIHPTHERDRDSGRVHGHEEISHQHLDNVIKREGENRERSIDRSNRESMRLHPPAPVTQGLRCIHGPNGALDPQPHPQSMPQGASMGGPSSQNQMAPVQNFVVPAYGSSHASETEPQQFTRSHMQLQNLLSMPGSKVQPQPAIVPGVPTSQPILNDALSYLDQVKVQFHETPEIYNHFLDIMKDFKSGAIDTPGVIDRVSTLFAGNPDLIQGFNTFLPQGYQIEYGTGDNPNAIKVTTPMGTSVTNISPCPRAGNFNRTSHQADRQFCEGPRIEAPSWPPIHGSRAPDGKFAANGHLMSQCSSHVGTGLPDSSPGASYDAQGQRHAVSHTDQRNVMQLSHAISGLPSGYNREQSRSSNHNASYPQAGLSNRPSTPQPGPPSNSEKRAPLEFNHAISYVNKIKNRFASQPDTYKQFLDALQTYQKESKLIQDVYAQVTRLFGAAPDLLEDFKQFLPESAAPPKTNPPTSSKSSSVGRDENFPGCDITVEPNYPQTQQGSTPARPSPSGEQQARLPPVGNFAPTPSTRENKRKRVDRPSAVGNYGGGIGSGSLPANMAESRSLSHMSDSKRVKQSHPSKPGHDPGAASFAAPNAPAHENHGQPFSVSPVPDELTFFDRAKRYIGNKNSFHEFLKLIHLFNKDFIDKTLLVYRSYAFIGGNPELHNWFKNYLGFEDSDVIIKAKAKPFQSKISLSACRGLGPSYRLLPKRRTHAACSGRDQLCWSVLNDAWVSHPTWASEDSGFVAHKKNVHEEGLHRIEEERHEYDLKIETITRTIQLLQPIAQSLRVMTPAERENFRLPPGLGGHSDTVYKRVIMRLYGRERGADVLKHLFARPYVVVPILLVRMETKYEDWKSLLREWEKLWREQTQKIFWKSLDHQHAQLRYSDKRQFQTKSLQSEIQIIYEEQKRRREICRISQPSYQLSYNFDDLDVVLDAASLLLSYAMVTTSCDYAKVEHFVTEFVGLFFGIDTSGLERRISPGSGALSSDQKLDENSDNEDPAPSKSPKCSRKSNLLREVLDPGRSSKSEDRSAAGNTGSCPEAGVAYDQQADSINSKGPSRSPMNGGGEEGTANVWLIYPTEPSSMKAEGEHSTQSKSRSTYHMYSTLLMYCFFRTFVALYERLYNLKSDEEDVQEQVHRAQRDKAAKDLRMIDKFPSDFFPDTSATANYYSQVLVMFQEQLRGERAASEIEYLLRRFYLQHGWMFYSFDKLIHALLRFTVSIVVNDGKDRTMEYYNLFKKDRPITRTTAQEELNYKKMVENPTRDREIYKISYSPSERRSTISLLKRDDGSSDISRLELERQWSYYISSYQTLGPTENVPESEIMYPWTRRLLRRSRAGGREHDKGGWDDLSSFSDLQSSEKLEIRICLENYRPTFSPGKEEWWFWDGREGKPGGDRNRDQRQLGSESTKPPSDGGGDDPDPDRVAYELFVRNPKWMQKSSEATVREKISAYERLVERTVGNRHAEKGRAKTRTSLTGVGWGTGASRKEEATDVEEAETRSVSSEVNDGMGKGR